MAKFCGKCGSKLDELTGLCPKCDAEILPQQTAEHFKEIEQPEDKKTVLEKPLSKKESKKQKKADKKAAKKAKKKEKRAGWSTGKTVRRFFLKTVRIFLLFAILAVGISGLLVYFDVADVPIISDLMMQLNTSATSEESEFSRLEGKFTNVKVIDEKSAILAAQDGAKKLGISDVAKELTLDNVNTVGDFAYYRLQQNYLGYPVYGKTFVVIADGSGDVSGMIANCFSITIDEIDPAVTQENVNACIKNYIIEITETSDIDCLDIESLSEDNLCIYALEEQCAKLVYQLYVNTEYGNFTFFVDANNAEIIYCANNISSIQKKFTYKGQRENCTFTAEAGTQVNEMHYVGQDGTDIRVYTPDSEHQYDWYNDNNSILVSWSGTDTPDASAVDAMYNVSNIYNYYLKTFNRSSFNNECEDIDVYIHTVGYRDYGGNNQSKINNAYFWVSPNGPIISLTKRYDDAQKEIDEYSCEVDVIGHEFTHGVIAYTSRLADSENNLMPGAINEAIADIMGYCAESEIQGKEIDWTSSVRTSIKNNNSNSSYIYHFDDYEGDKKECHSASTIISYAAYLMNSAEEGSLNSHEIAELWYHTALTLPSNCTFKVLRQNMEMVAKNLRLSEKQKTCIANAFDAVGISLDTSKSDDKYNTDITLKVFDCYSVAYDDYTVSIDGVYNTGWFGWSWFGWFQKEYSTQFSVHTAEQQLLSLENNGEYTIKVTDNKDGSASYEKFVKVKEKYENKVICFATEYGNRNIKIANEREQADIPSDAVEFNGHYYYVYDIDTITDWNMAQEYCESKGGYLATITSVEEDAFLYSYITDEGYRSAMFGLTDQEQTNDWHWVTGEKFSYHNWRSGEPSHQGGYEHYAMYYEPFTDGTWNDGSGQGGPFICEWGECTVGVQEQIRTTSDERDIVLALDVSGSMAGTPMEETRKASTNFIETILEEDASIGIVTYDSSAYRVSDFSVNKRSLESMVSSIRDGGGTNIEAGLKEADSMLTSSNAKKKIILLMSDGSPNEGKEGDELVAYADEIKDSGVLIYTLGFFESMGDSKSSSQILMERIASDGCHYEVANADDLVFFFEDMADQINGQKYIYVRIACPVDVSVTSQGQTLSSVEKDMNVRTDFGTLTFEENDEAGEDETDDRIKVLRLKEGTDYDLQLVGTGHGLMDYTIGFMDDEGNYSDLRKFENVKVTKRTVIDTVAAISKESTLNIDENGDGKYDLRLRAGKNGYGEEIGQSYYIYIIIGGVGLIIAVGLIIVHKVRTKKKGKVK